MEVGCSVIELKYSARNFSMTLQIESKFNFIIGNSGTGKSLLAIMADEFSSLPSSRVVKPKQVYSNVRRDITPYIDTVSDSVFILDEGFEKAWLDRVIDRMKASSNYFIFITRDGLANVPYGYYSIFRMAGAMRNLFMIPMYRREDFRRSWDGRSIYVEDSGLGLTVLLSAVGSRVLVRTCGGKDNILNLVHMHKENPLVIFDACGIGYNAGKLFAAQREGLCALFDSLSFEQEILSKVFPKFYTEFSGEMSDAWASEEDYYVSQLSGLLNRLLGLSYNKNSNDLAKLFEVGIVNSHAGYVNLQDIGGRVRAAYPEMRDEELSVSEARERLLWAVSCAEDLRS